MTKLIRAHLRHSRASRSPHATGHIVQENTQRHTKDTPTAAASGRPTDRDDAFDRLRLSLREADTPSHDRRHTARPVVLAMFVRRCAPAIQTIAMPKLMVVVAWPWCHYTTTHVAAAARTVQTYNHIYHTIHCRWYNTRLEISRNAGHKSACATHRRRRRRHDRLIL